MKSESNGAKARPLVVAKPLDWSDDGHGDWSEPHYGFWISKTLDPDVNEGPVTAGWGEGESETFDTVDEAKARCAEWAQGTIDDTAMLTGGLARIAAERARQIDVEGWTPEHDAEHADGALAMAAGCYALQSGLPDDVRNHHRDHRADDDEFIPAPWPWDRDSWKPGRDNSTASRIRELEKAGALIVAELDRLLARQAA